MGKITWKCICQNGDCWLKLLKFRPVQSIMLALYHINFMKFSHLYHTPLGLDKIDNWPKQLSTRCIFLVKLFQRIRCYSLPFNIQVSFHNFKILFRETFLFQIDIKSSTENNNNFFFYIKSDLQWPGDNLFTLHRKFCKNRCTFCFSYFYLIQIHNYPRLHINNNLSLQIWIFYLSLYIWVQYSTRTITLRSHCY